MAFSLKLLDTYNMQSTVMVKIFSGNEYDDIIVGKRYQYFNTIVAKTSPLTLNMARSAKSCMQPVGKHTYSEII